MTELLLGVDGGGSKTSALIADRSGAVLGCGRSGTSNYQAIGFMAATTALDQAITRAREDAGLTNTPCFAAACLGIAGVGRPADRSLLDAWMLEHRIAERYLIVNDAELLLAAGTPEGWGIGLIAGTGSICYGRTPDGRTARAGGWGYLLGDEGSGYDIALRALRLATQTADGRAGARMLLDAVLDHWQLRDPSELIPHVYHSGMDRVALASLAAVVARQAEAGDRDARRVLEDAADELARMIKVVADQLETREPPIALGGGLLGASPSLRAMIVVAHDLRAGPVAYVDEPVHGAMVIARQVLEAMPHSSAHRVYRKG
jgi:N-acetylglucosamine kinase-like BadF-type ATPase